MARPRFTISRLMVAVLFIGLGLAGLKIAQLSARIRRLQEDAAQKQATLTAIIRAWRDGLDRPRNALDLPDGYVTAVDDERQEVVLNITRGQGAVPHLRMVAFGPDSLGVPTAREKGLIELIRVDEKSSTARILPIARGGQPLRVGDVVYSPVWSPNHPTRFALIGVMDANRDNRDDRDDLKRSIRAAGGIVDFDLPPPELGEESGTLSPMIDWYVVDNRAPRQALPARHMSDTVKEARLDGIRPMPLERLLEFLGYDRRQPATAPARARHGTAG